MCRFKKLPQFIQNFVTLAAKLTKMKALILFGQGGSQFIQTESTSI
jgi:hypothetical protein